MKTDKLKQFVALRNSLVNEKAALERRLTEINKALGASEAKASIATAPKNAPPRRIENPMSLKEAMRQVTAAKPLTKKEILEAIHKIGYRFAAKDPRNSMNVILYTKGNFKNQNGKFSPLK